MKVSKWKVLSIAGALVLSYAVASDAAQIKVDEDTFADLGFWMKVRYVYFDERGKEKDWSKNIIDVVDARFNIEGQINNVVQFYGEVVTSGSYDEDVYWLLGIHERDTKAKFSEGGVNLVFVPELQLRFGKIRIPFTRDQQESPYTHIVQTERLYDPYRLFEYWRDGLLRAMDGGAVLHGEFGGGMLRYDVGIFNQASDEEPLNSVAWVARVEFTPTMLGFHPETKTSGRGWLHDTYLGEEGDILSIGVGYFDQDVAVDVGSGVQTGFVEDGVLLPGGTPPSPFLEELDVDAFTIDGFLEKKIGYAILNLEGAYVNFDESHFGSNGDKEDAYYWYVQGQLLYDGVVGIGKPAIFAKYEYAEADRIYNNKDFEISRWGGGINYYIKGHAAFLSAGFDNVSYDEGAEDLLRALNEDDNITDYYIQAQIMF